MAQLDLLNLAPLQVSCLPADTLNDSLSESCITEPSALFHEVDFSADEENDISAEPEILHKAAGAYKTISEVSEELDVPQHVLRFWESHFPQVKPSRMRGSRRYYRPEDVDTLKKIKTLLYKQGYTIKGAKKLVRDKSLTETQLQMEIPSPAIAATPVSQEITANVKTAPKAPLPDIQFLLGELRSLKVMLKEVAQ